MLRLAGQLASGTVTWMTGPATVESGVPRAGSDAAEVRWVPIPELEAYDTTEGLADMVHRAAHIKGG
jgi:hypothetical protein